MIFDLAHPLTTGMPVYPGDPGVFFSPALTHAENGFSVHALSMGTHAGTHLDAPFHRFESGVSVDALSVLNATVGTAIVVPVDRGEDEEIGIGDLGEYAGSVEAGSRILLATGWSERFGREGFFKHYPSISIELAEFFAGKGIALLGVESPSLHTTESARVHKTLLSAGVIVVETLANLRAIAGQKVFFSAAPLRLAGLDGSPVRAYAITG